MALKRRIIDRRNKKKYQVDDSYLNGYARLCGVYGTAVYNSLCRHSNTDQYSFPSIELMAEQHGCSKPPIIKGIKSLEEWKIIEVVREKGSHGKQKNNGYILLDKSEWKPKPSKAGLPGTESTTFTQPSKGELLDRVNEVYCKDTHTKETHTKGITKVIEAEPQEYGNSDVNWVMDTFKKHRGFNSSGRGKKDRFCAKHLLNNYSKDQIQAMLLFCETNEYAPRVGSVEKLWYKRGDIIAGIKALQQKSIKSQILEI